MDQRIQKVMFPRIQKKLRRKFFSAQPCYLHYAEITAHRNQFTTIIV